MHSVSNRSAAGLWVVADLISALGHIAFGTIYVGIIRLTKKIAIRLPYLAAIATTNSMNAAVDEIVRTWFHSVQSVR